MTPKGTSVMDSCVNDTIEEDAVNPEGLGVSLRGIISQGVLPAVCVFGIVGNMLNLAILTRRKLQKSFRTLELGANLCLISLALSDLMFCVFALLTMFLPANSVYEKDGILLLYGLYNVYIINIFILWSTMLTVAMSLERYLAICFPLRQDIYLTTRRIKYIIVLTFIFSVGFNVPVMWRNEKFKLCSKKSEETVTNLTTTFKNFTSPPNVESKTADVAIIHPTLTLAKDVFNGSFLTYSSIHIADIQQLETSSVLSSSYHSLFSDDSSVLSRTSSPVSSMPSFSVQDTRIPLNNTKTLYTIKTVLLSNNSEYDFIYRLVWAFVGNLLPLILLFFFNVNLCRKIYGSYKLQRRLGRQKQARSSSYNLTLTLVAIVTLFFILVAPSEITMTVTQVTRSTDSPHYKNIEAVLNLMQSINFSVNFILYCIINPHFRKTLKLMMCCHCYNDYQVSRNSKKDFETSLL